MRTAESRCKLAFADLFEQLKNAAFNFGDIAYLISEFFANMMADPHVSLLKDIMWGYIAFLEPFIPFILIALYAIVACFGKKIFGILRFLSFFVCGFALGVYLLSPLVLSVIPTLPTWIIGVVVGIIASVMSKLLYVLCLAAVSGYSVYLICFRGDILPSLTSFTAGNAVYSLGIVAIVLLLVFILRKYVEMVGTAMLGGFGIACVVRGLYDYTSLPTFVGREWLGVLVATLIFALIGLIVQIRTRSRY